MDEQPKRMDISEFRRNGYLQEANRLFFHPLGLALEVQIDDYGNESLGGIWDYRDDPEGILYHADELSSDKAEWVAEELERHEDERERLMGDIIQPINFSQNYDFGDAP